MGTEEPCIKLFNTELFQDEESGADITSRIHQTPFLKTQQQTVGKQEGRCFAYICPIFSTFPLPQGGVDSSVRPMRTFQFDLNEVMDGMKRRENVLAAHCSLFELNKTCGKRAPQNFLSEIFLAQSFL